MRAKVEKVFFQTNKAWEVPIKTKMIPRSISLPLVYLPPLFYRELQNNKFEIIDLLCCKRFAKSLRNEISNPLSKTQAEFCDKLSKSQFSLKGAGTYANLVGIKTPRNEASLLQKERLWKIEFGPDVFKKEFYLNKLLGPFKWNVDSL